MDMQKILEYRNARNRFCQRVGITVTELSPGYAKVVKTVTEDDLNPVERPSTAAPSAYSTSGSRIRTEIWMAPAPSPSTT